MRTSAMLSRAQNTFHHNPRLRGPVSSIMKWKKKKKDKKDNNKDRQKISKKISKKNKKKKL